MAPSPRISARPTTCRPRDETTPTVVRSAVATLACATLAVVSAPAAWAQSSTAPPPTGSTRASSEAPPPRHRLLQTTYVAARLNPLGLFAQMQLSYRFRLYEGEGALLRDNYVSIGLLPTISPAFARLGAQLEVQPVAALRLTGAIESSSYFGTFNLFQSFPTVTAPFSDSDIKRGGEADLEYRTNVLQATLGALLQARLGSIVVRNNLRGVYFNAATRNGDRAFYDQFFDVMAPDDGWVLFDDADLLYEIKPGFLVGARFHLAHAIYEGRHYLPGEDRTNPNTPMMRLGPFAAYRLSEDDGSLFHSPTLVLSAQWHLAHRWRTGEDTSAGLPMILLAFAFSSDLASSSD
jgi:hypothetical protein